MLPRGSVLGGSSAINAMVFMRGSTHDYDAWEKMGATGWRYKDVLPYFKKLENASAILPRSKDRGTSGPLKLSYPYAPPISRYFVAAGKELGKSVCFVLKLPLLRLHFLNPFFTAEEL